MRTIIAAAIALVAGLIIGSLGPREDLREAEAQIATLEAKLKTQKRPNLTSGLLNLGGSGGRRYDPPPNAAEPSKEGAGDVSRESAVEEADENQGDDAEPIDDDAIAEDERKLTSGEQIEKARTALELRRTQARAALLERANLNDDQLASFDDTIARMNEGLEVIAEDVAAYVEEGREPSRREAMHLAADVLDVLLEADNSFGEIMTEDQVLNAGEEAVDPLSYIDPRLIDMFEGL